MAFKTAFFPLQTVRVPENKISKAQLKRILKKVVIMPNFQYKTLQIL